MPRERIPDEWILADLLRRVPVVSLSAGPVLALAFVLTLRTRPASLVASLTLVSALPVVSIFVGPVLALARVLVPRLRPASRVASLTLVSTLLVHRLTHDMSFLRLGVTGMRAHVAPHALGATVLHPTPF